MCIYNSAFFFEDESLRLSFVIYKRPTFFIANNIIPDLSKCSEQVATYVISVVTNKRLESNGLVTLHFRDKFVCITYLLKRLNIKGIVIRIFQIKNNSKCEITKNKKYICAFWDYINGNWNSSGCTYTALADGTHKCVCDHLTNFAVLLVRF